MRRAYYSSNIRSFLKESKDSVLGKLTANHSNKNLDQLQISAWREQISILKNQLEGLNGQVYFEFTIPRMGKRVDNIVIINDVIFIIEFKIGANRYDQHAIDQVIDYAIDLENFHEGSHNKKLIPILVASNAEDEPDNKNKVLQYKTAANSSQKCLTQTLKQYLGSNNPHIDIKIWENSIYKPTPTIVEAAQALYKGHNVREITRSDSGTINLSKTAGCIKSVIEESKKQNIKSICFVTGVPGAGKTLAGLNIAVDRMNVDQDEHAVFLSGNGPLVDVLRESLARDEVKTAKEKGEKLTKKQAAIKANAFIQNIHHFRDDNLLSDKEPIEKVVIFDEAQRAWTKDQLCSFMKKKKNKDAFNKSEPEFLIEVMDRHSNWCTIVCLIGGGQEINTGEAGLEEWISSLRNYFPDWNIYYSNSILENDNYLKSEYSKNWLIKNGANETELHLAVSVRSFRSEQLSNFIHELLNINIANSQQLYYEIKKDYPIVLTRDLEKAKQWLRNKARGSERIGLVSSSGAKRLRSLGINVENEISTPNWFLNDDRDVRSSYFLEEVATEFAIQGLEIDWACVAWDGNFYINNRNWEYQKFRGAKWQSINKDINKEYLKNAYRVLLTRARQGMVIFIPEHSDIDHTRPKEYYDETYNFLKEIGIDEI